MKVMRLKMKVTRVKVKMTVIQEKMKMAKMVMAQQERGQGSVLRLQRGSGTVEGDDISGRSSLRTREGVKIGQTLAEASETNFCNNSPLQSSC